MHAGREAGGGWRGGEEGRGAEESTFCLAGLGGPAVVGAFLAEAAVAEDR